jgi:small subunit ribosomal protein S21
MSSDPTNFKQKGLYVEVHNNDINKALRKLKKLIQVEGVFQTLRDREHFEKPSMTRKKARARAVKRWQKKQRELKSR